MSLWGQLRVLALAATAIGLVAAAALSQRDGADGEVRVLGHLGPTPGPNSQGHVAAKRAYLERIARHQPDASAAGLVSLTKAVAARDAAALVRGMDIRAVFVTFPNNEPEALPVRGSVSSVMRTRAQEIADLVRAEASSLEAQVRNAQGPEREALMRSLTDRQRALAAIGPQCPCIYALAVEGATLGALNDLQGRAEVRLVDVPRPVTDDLAGWELTPILPS